jgi:SSS family solute:Na+ symporter
MEPGMHLQSLDYTVVIVYGILLLILAQWVSREKAGHQKTTQDYFLAGRALPWWAIGASLIAANISAEQIIGMSGSAYLMGFAIASYEWMAALTLIIVAKYLLPVFLKYEIYTMPQFLEQRFDHRVRMVMATFWLGSLAINSVTGLDQTIGLVILGLFAVSYSLYGGLKAVALTDIIQVVLLVFGGLMIAWIAMNEISGGNGALAGFIKTMEVMPEKFDMIFTSDLPYYNDLPGISVLVGGMWIMNLSYWGFNQYIIQRALAAKNTREAQKGIVFAAFLKMLVPVLVVLPGIAAAILIPGIENDRAYPELMKLLPVGLKGLVFAALIAAIVSSLASMTNSISTIFTMDMYKHFKPDVTDQRQLVMIGRTVAFSAMVVAMIVARPLLGNFDQAFQYIQEFTGFFTPGIVAIFLLGFFYRRTTANGALSAAIGSAVLSLGFKLIWPALPFIDRVGLVFLLCMIIGVLISRWEHGGEHPKAVNYGEVDISTSASFNLASLVIILMLAGLYIAWW